MNPYTKGKPSVNMKKANTALHAFKQVDNN